MAKFKEGDLVENTLFLSPRTVWKVVTIYYSNDPAVDAQYSLIDAVYAKTTLYIKDSTSWTYATGFLPAVSPYTVGTMLKQRAGTALYEVTAADPDKDDYTLYNHSAGHSFPGITEKDLNTWFVIDTKSVRPMPSLFPPGHIQYVEDLRVGTQIPGSGTKTCQHTFVEVGFNHTKMVCKHCDMEQK